MKFPMHWEIIMYLYQNKVKINKMGIDKNTNFAHILEIGYHKK